MLITATTELPNIISNNSYAITISGYAGGRVTELEYEDENGWHEYDGTSRNADCELIFTAMSGATRITVTGGTGTLAVNTFRLRDGSTAVSDSSVPTFNTDGDLAVVLHDQTTRSLDFFFGRLDNLTTLSADADPEDMTLTLTSTTGFTAGKTVGVFSLNDVDGFYLGGQIGAPAGSVITVDTPVDIALASGSAIAATTTNMAVDGSSTTQVFQIGPVGPGSTSIVDITRIMGHLLDSTAMDDGKFGGITALTNGVVLRKNDGVITNLWNVKTNADLALICYDFTYSDKAPGGQFGVNFRNTYAGQGGHGVVLELVPGEYLEVLIQDDLTGLDEFTMMAQGHFKDVTP